MPQDFRPSILIGADPEMFIRNKLTKKFVSAHNLLPGTKEKPYKVDYGAIQVDGTAAEFNITPANNADYFSMYCTNVMQNITTRIGLENELVLDSVAMFDRDYFDNLPDTAKELGCVPDIDAYTGEFNPKPDTSFMPTMRTASGHIHIGWTKGKDVNDFDHVQDCFTAVKQLDYYLGIMGNVWDRDNRRRQLYGKAGACRIKPYGVEYRVLSNKWLRDPRMMQWVYNQSYKAVMSLYQGGDILDEEYGELARETINSGNEWWKDKKHDLVKVCTKYDLAVPPFQDTDKKVMNASY